MLRIERPLPGEWEGTLDPRDYGFDVIPVEPQTREEVELGMADFYRRARARSGVDIPSLNPYLALQPYDPAPAEALLARHETLEYPYACEFGLATLEVDEDVFVPTLTHASPFLLDTVDFRPGERVLDAFSGSGAFGVHAALRGAEVVSFDVSSHAVACATKNASLNGVSKRVDVRHGTLGEAVKPDERFDLVIANPPLAPGEPDSLLETAMFDQGMQATIDLIEALPTLLTRTGRCYLLTSDVIDRNDYKCDIAALCRQSGLKMKIVAGLHREYESYRVHKIERRRLPFLFAFLRQI